MRFIRFFHYFLQLRTLLGLKAAYVFALVHMWNKINPPRDGRLARIPVGPYTFYFPSLEYFLGLFTEIFFKETYYIAPTSKPIRVIDCGANIGMSLLYIKTQAPNARVTCFEPNPAARAVLEKNVEVNGWGKEVRIFHYALGKKKGTVEFFVDDRAATSSGGSVANHLGERGRIVDSYMVEVDVLSHYIDGNIDLLKIDVEGGEFDILEELIAQNKLSHVSTIQLEYHYIPKFFTRPLSEMLTLLESGGFRIFVQPTASASSVTSHDVAHFYMIFAWR